MTWTKYGMGLFQNAAISVEKSLVNVFIDGKTINGPWAIMCPICHELYGVSIGIGLGQEYIKQDDGHWYDAGQRRPTE